MTPEALAQYSAIRDGTRACREGLVVVQAFDGGVTSSALLTSVCGAHVDPESPGPGRVAGT